MQQECTQFQGREPIQFTLIQLELTSNIMKILEKIIFLVFLCKVIVSRLTCLGKILVNKRKIIKKSFKKLLES